MAKKLYYKIGEACKIVDIQPYVLRYWETEFPFLAPNKSKSGQRVYNDREIVVIRRIKELLYDEGYTIAGAKKKLEAELAAEEAGESPATSSGTSPSKASASGSGKASQKSVKQPSATVDIEGSEKIEKLRSGLTVALDQARGILDLLPPETS